MGATENYDISWKNFESRMSHSFADIRNHDQFLDVTLAADTADGSVEALRAHKVILSACSPVLRSLLTKQSDLSPYSPFMPIMLYLRGISARDLNHVLEFIYKGSVSLAQDELNDFLAVAESLQIPLGEEAGEPARRRAMGEAAATPQMEQEATAATRAEEFGFAALYNRIREQLSPRKPAAPLPIEEPELDDDADDVPTIPDLERAIVQTSAAGANDAGVPTEPGVGSEL